MSKKKKARAARDVDSLACLGVYDGQSASAICYRAIKASRPMAPIMRRSACIPIRRKPPMP